VEISEYRDWLDKRVNKDFPVLTIRDFQVRRAMQAIQVSRVSLAKMDWPVNQER
jgi:hypothetical protein